MPRNHHTATAPDGTIFKRVSENRVYSHAIIGQYSYERHMARAISEEAYQADLRDYTYHSYVAQQVGGVPTQMFRLPERTITYKASDIERSQALATQHASAEACANWRREARRTNIEAQLAEGYFEKWLALGWASTADLAAKAIGQHKSYINHRLAPATMVRK